MSESGIASVALSILGTHMAMVPDAAIQLGLELVAAAQAARGEQAIHDYSKKHSLNTEELLRILRNGK